MLLRDTAGLVPGLHVSLEASILFYAKAILQFAFIHSWVGRKLTFETNMHDWLWKFRKYDLSGNESMSVLSPGEINLSFVF